ncbi:MAG: HAD family hydrolase [Prevotella sp.]|jgi:HAD superfamily hydrolase (TIGR01509 family)
MEEEIKQYLKTHLPEGERWTGFKAVLFDMDGVLYNSMPRHAIAWQKSMAQFGINMTAGDAYATEGARGVDTIRMMVRKQKGKEISEEEAQRMYDVKTELFHQMSQAPVFEGVLELMEKIHQAGLSVNVVTGSGQRPLIKRLLTDFGRYLDEEHITTAYDVKRGKPNPDPYLAGLRKAGNLKPWQGIVVENAPLGVKSGVAAGCFTVAINSGPLSDEQLLNAGAHLLYQRISELRDDFDELMKISAKLV